MVLRDPMIDAKLTHRARRVDWTTTGSLASIRTA